MGTLAAALCLWLHATPAVAGVAFRFADLDLRDPHVYFDFIGCRDLTDNQLVGFSFNGDIQNRITQDADGDGALDLSYLLVFDVADPAAAGGTLRFGVGACPAPAPPDSCEAGAAPTQWLGYQVGSAICLEVLPGTTRPYVPAISVPAAPCFVTDPASITLLLGDIPVTLHEARIAATFVDGPSSGLVNGLIRGFLSESDANETILPASFALAGGQPFSVLLPGGDPPGSGVCCSMHSDKDIGPGGEPGWWFYLNFTATPVEFVDPTTGVGDAATGRFVLSGVRPNPSIGTVEIAFSIDQPAGVRLSIHDLQGREVASPAHGRYAAGTHVARWDGRHPDGRRAASGVYFARLEAGGRIASRRIVLAR